MVTETTYRETHPLTSADLLKFRALIVGYAGGPDQQRQELAKLLGKTRTTMWRYETGATISDGVVMRRALVQLADERGVQIPEALRYGRAQKAQKGVRS